ATLTGDGDPEQLIGQTVSAEFFPLLKTRPLLGRVFRPDDDVPDAPRVAIVSHELWQRRFGGDPNIIGKKIELEAVVHEVIGVTPPDFYFVSPMAEYWTPYRIDRRRDWR